MGHSSAVVSSSSHICVPARRTGDADPIVATPNLGPGILQTAASFALLLQLLAIGPS